MGKRFNSQSLEVRLHRVRRSFYRQLDLSLEPPTWVLSHVIEGEVLTRTGDVSSVAHPGQVMVHHPHYRMSEQNPNPGLHEWIAVDAWQGDFEFFKIHPLPPLVDLRDSRRYREVFARLLEVRNPLEEFALTTELLVEVVRSWEVSGSPSGHDLNGGTRFSKIVSFIDENLSKGLSRETLAKRVNLHPGSFDRAFRAEFGVSPMELVRRKRIQLAKRLLSSTDYTLEQIGDSTGLGTAPNFSRAFRQVTGESPGHFRACSKVTMEEYAKEFNLDEA